MNDLNDRYEDLAAAIIERAAMDYHNARFVLDTIDERCLGADIKANRDIIEVKNFMYSGWFNTLCDLDGPRAFQALEKTYKNEMKFDIAEKYYNLSKEHPVVKGYPVASGYKGWTKDGWIFFKTEEAYKNYMRDLFTYTNVEN